MFAEAKGMRLRGCSSPASRQLLSAFQNRARAINSSIAFSPALDCVCCVPLGSGYHLSMDAQSPCLSLAPKTEAVIDDRSARDGPLNFLFFHGEIANFLDFNSRQHAKFIYYFGPKC